MFQLSEESLSVRWQILAQDHVVLSSVVFTGKKLPLTTLFQSLIKVGVPESAFYANSVFTAVKRTHQTKKTRSETIYGRHKKSPLWRCCLVGISC